MMVGKRSQFRRNRRRTKDCFKNPYLNVIARNETQLFAEWNDEATFSLLLAVIPTPKEKSLQT